jgi:L-lactate permease
MALNSFLIIINLKSYQAMNKTVVIAALIALTAVTVFYVQESKEVDAFEQWKLSFGTPFAPEE